MLLQIDEFNKIFAYNETVTLTEAEEIIKEHPLWVWYEGDYNFNNCDTSVKVKYYYDRKSSNIYVETKELH